MAKQSFFSNPLVIALMTEEELELIKVENGKATIKDNCFNTIKEYTKSEFIDELERIYQYSYESAPLELNRSAMDNIKILRELDEE